MITNKIVIKEVDELKSVLSQGNAEIPSFWVCIWPGFFWQCGMYSAQLLAFGRNI